MTDNQNQLTAHIKQGDEEAFKEIYLSFFNAVVYFISKYIEDDDIVKDLSQESFYLLWKNRAKLNEAIGFKSYLLCIAKNLILNHIRSNNYNKKYIDTVKKKASEESFSNKMENAMFNQIENHNILELVFAKINELPQKQKDVFIMSKIKFMTNKEIAKTLGISVKTVEYRMMCALREVRKIMEQ